MKAEASELRCCFLITYRCNCRCSMCGVWKRYEEHAAQSSREIGTDSFFPFVDRHPRVTTYILNGGEPFMRYDFLREVTRYLLERDKAVWIVSNGMMTEQIVGLYRELSARGEPEASRACPSGSPLPGISFSVDGIGAVHDAVRGVRGAYERVLASIRGVQALQSCEVHIPMQIGMTITKDNYHQLGEVYALSRELGVGFDWGVALVSEHHLNNREQRFQLPDTAVVTLAGQVRDLIRAEVKHAANDGDWFRGSLRMQHSRDLIALLRRRRRIPSAAGRSAFLLDPYGTIFPSSFMTGELGSILQNDEPYFWLHNMKPSQSTADAASGVNLFWRHQTRGFKARAVLHRWSDILRGYVYARTSD